MGRWRRLAGASLIGLLIAVGLTNPRSSLLRL
jgi:hypothetical protein